MSENLQKSSEIYYDEHKARAVSSDNCSNCSGSGIFGGLCYGLHLIDPEED